MRKSLRTRLTVIFIGLATIPLLLVGVVLTERTLTAQRQQALNLQQQIAKNVGTEVETFIRARESELLLLAELQGRQELDREEQTNLLSGLLSYQDVYDELTLLDNQGQEQIHLSLLETITPNQLGNRSGTAEFNKTARGETYFSSVQFDEVTDEPFMTIAVPLFDAHSGEFDGVLVARFRFRTVWDIISQAHLWVTGSNNIYLVSEADNTVIAHQDPAVVRNKTQFKLPHATGFYTGLDGTEVTLAVVHIILGNQEFDVAAEVPASEALALAINTAYVTIGAIIVAIVIASTLGFLAARQIVYPIKLLAATTHIISDGDLSQQVEITSQDEVGELAHSFNNMTTSLRETLVSLERRTQRLKIVATLSERLSAILNFDQLLDEMVNQVKKSFDYYHAHVYILDKDHQNLVAAAGVGKAGAEMKARGHHIPLKASTSLVARAARTGKIVQVDNVREVEDWLFNPFLPDTYSEMAIPIILEGQVVGVLDVQEDKIAGLGESDANLLRSLASHMAVAIHNARLFEQVETALAEARIVQEQYVEQAWSKVKAVEQGAEYQHQRFGVQALNQTVMAQLEQEAIRHSQPAIVTVTGGGNEQSDQAEALGSDGAGEQSDSATVQLEIQNALVAPIRLRNQTIGAIQLHETEQEHHWSEQELALVQAIADQVAQTAENLRLFDDTRELVGREQNIREITDKLRTAPNIDALLETAARELGQQLGVRHTVLELGIEATESMPGGDKQTEPNGTGTEVA